MQRRYILNVPTNYDNTKPYRLIIAYHERDGNDDQMYNNKYYHLLTAIQQHHDLRRAQRAIEWRALHGNGQRGFGLRLAEHERLGLGARRCGRGPGRR